MIRIEIVHSPQPRRVDVVPLELGIGSTAGQALAMWLAIQRHATDASAQALDSTPGDGVADGYLQAHQAAAGSAELSAWTGHLGVWGRRVPFDTVLREGDRLELYRPLLCDPKESRRRRQRLAAQARTGASATRAR
jgi:putative ubiquitin-RnfH superfamily antitoxin RatB of RatAB toxin-antitoxin module